MVFVVYLVMCKCGCGCVDVMLMTDVEEKPDLKERRGVVIALPNVTLVTHGHWFDRCSFVVWGICWRFSKFGETTCWPFISP